MAPRKTDTGKTIQIPAIKFEAHWVYIIGSAPLIVHAFTEKARKQMLDKQMKQAKGGFDARDPFAEVEAARYQLPDGRDGFPAIGLKACAVTACTSLSDVTKVAARQAFRVEGIPMKAPGVLPGAFVRTALIPIIAHPHTIREDVARLAGIGRTPEMRYRPEYDPWGMKFRVYVNTQVISFGQLCSMYQAAGYVGIGEMRPERDQDCGTFDLVSEAEFKAWLDENGLSDKAPAKLRKVA